MTAESQAVAERGHSAPDDLSRKLAVLRDAYEAERYPDIEVRKDRLQRLWSALDRHAQRLCEALNSDFGHRSPKQSYFTDIATTGKSIRLTRKGLARWMKPEKRKVDFPFSVLGASARVEYQPLGVVGILSPWNVPVNLTLTPLAGVLGAGNRAMIKPSEHTPATSQVMVELIASAFSDDEVTTVTGGADIGQRFSALAFDHLVFTGGTAIARHIMRVAADNLTPLTLELGGKSPVLVGEDADLNLAAKRTVFGKVFNAGQVCLAPDYVLVHERQREALVSAIQAEIQATLPEGAMSDDYVAVINERQSDRIKAYLDEARAAGARVWSADAGQGRRIPITLIVDPPEDLRVCHEEIFGPLLVVRSYAQFAQALDYINARPRPLALYYFGNNATQRRQVIQDTVSGGVTINDVVMHYTFDDLPFGGVGPSGMGAYHGFDGFRQFSHARAVYHQTRFDLGRIIRPPYGRAFELFSRHVMTRG
ncbi:MAG: coniferyl aldehyde dehydrogenase [Oceanococcus sp.]|nr:MAG: coniferyl aldehyde dehydrogenase [Oceanococcus sp.]